MNKVLDRVSPVPLKEQLKNWLLSRISEGKFKAGERIPSINQMSKEMGVARETVRQTLEVLVQQDVLVPEHGKGYYVKARENRHLNVGILAKVDGVYVRPVYDILKRELGDSVTITFVDFQGDDESLSQVIRNLAYQQSVDRLLIVSPRGAEERVADLVAPCRRYFDIAWLDRSPATHDDAAFVCDYAAVANLAASRFLESGSESLFYFSRLDEDESIFSKMRESFGRTAGRRGKQYHDIGDLIRDVRSEVEVGRRCALFTETNDEGVYAQCRLQHAGIKVPDQLVHISCDNTKVLELAYPSITAIDPGFEDIGMRVADWIRGDFFYRPEDKKRQYTARPRLERKESF